MRIFSLRSFFMAALAIVVLFLSHPTFAQTVTFTAQVTQGDGQVIPDLTWDTSPLANDCTASGDWAGSKGGAGNEQLAPITSSATYNLTCTWQSSAATITWTAPTQNTDGSALTDLAGFNIYYGPSSGNYPSSVTGIPADQTVKVIGSLSTGSWFFVATAFNDLGVESALSGEATKVVADNEVTESVGITVNPQPAAPTGVQAL